MDTKGKQMKIVVVGAAGAVGSNLTRDLAQCAEVTDLVIAETDLELGEALRAEVAATATGAVSLVDGRDEATMVQTLEGADLLMNCASFVHAAGILDLAVRTGTNYADLMSHPTEEVRERVAASGIVAVPGLGTSPGMTNVLVRHAANELGSLQEVHILFAISRPQLAASRGGMDTVLWELGKYCPERMYYADGAYHPVGPREASRTVDFGERAGVREVFIVPHPETTTLPRNFPELRFCAVRGTWNPRVMDKIAVLNEYGLLDEDTHEQTKATLWRKIGQTLDPMDSHTWGLNVEVLAEGPNGRVRRVYEFLHGNRWPEQPVTVGTSVAAAVGAQLVARNATAGGRHGVVDPEAYFEPEEFLATLRERGTLDVRWSDTVA